MMLQGNIENRHHIKDLMTAKPMTAEQHAAIRRRRLQARRMIEDAREMAALTSNEPETL